jgi:hypothetical protein
VEKSFFHKKKSNVRISTRSRRFSKPPEVSTDFFHEFNELFKNFHRILQKGFPDAKGRVEYEKKQRDIYNSAQNKLKMSPLGLSSSKEFFSAEEKDAIAYFEGTGFYHYYQKIEKTPNIFDTRETFLLKMHNPQIRNNFLDALNRFEL